MIWNESFSSAYYATIVDKVTWKDLDRIEILGGSIERSADDLRQSADLDLTDDIGECFIRIYLEATQSDDTERVALFTGLTSAPEKSINGNRVSWAVECYSVLKPAEDVLMQRGYYAPANYPAGTLIKNLLSVCKAPINLTDGSPTLTESIIAEDGETNLSFVEKILEAIEWQIVIDGDGTINIKPYSDGIVSTFSVDNDVVQTEITRTKDWFSAPNVFRAISDDLTAVAKDEDSIESRGREVWMEETSVTLSDNESIAAYAMRRLAEEQAVADTISYTRRFLPTLNIGDMVYVHYPSVIDATGRITSQSFDLSHGCKTTEEIEV